MTKDKLRAILDLIPENADVSVEFSYDDVFSSNYNCELKCVGLSCSEDGSVKAVLMLSEQKTTALDSEETTAA